MEQDGETRMLKNRLRSFRYVDDRAIVGIINLQHGRHLDCQKTRQRQPDIIYISDLKPLNSKQRSQILRSGARKSARVAALQIRSQGPATGIQAAT